MRFARGVPTCTLLMVATLLSYGTSRAASPNAPAAEVEPSAGRWKTWVLTSGSQLRLPPPPDASSTAAELQQLRAMAARRDPARPDHITFSDSRPPPYRSHGTPP